VPGRFGQFRGDRRRSRCPHAVAHAYCSQGG